MSNRHASILLEQVLDPVARCLTPEAAKRLVALRADPAVQQRMDVLAQKQNEGALTADELDEYAAYVSVNDLLAIFQAKARRVLAQTPDPT